MKKKGIYIGIAAVIVVVIIIVVARSGSKKSTGSTSATSSSAGTSSATSDTSGAVATTSVNITNYMFTPMVVSVKVGSKVTWTNQDQVSHTVTADTASADAPSSSLIGQGQSYSFTFQKAGTYTFHCAVHPDMHGTVIVTN